MRCTRSTRRDREGEGEGEKGKGSVRVSKRAEYRGYIVFDIYTECVI